MLYMLEKNFYLRYNTSKIRVEVLRCHNITYARHEVIDLPEDVWVTLPNITGFKQLGEKFPAKNSYATHFIFISHLTSLTWKTFFFSGLQQYNRATTESLLRLSQNFYSFRDFREMVLHRFTVHCVIVDVQSFVYTAMHMMIAIASSTMGRTYIKNRYSIQVVNLGLIFWYEYVKLVSIVCYERTCKWNEFHT